MPTLCGHTKRLLLTILLFSCGACSNDSITELPNIFGPDPELPKPEKKLLPIVSVATANSWPLDKKPSVPDGFEVTEYAGNLDHPRWLYELPNGDILVAESNAPTQFEGLKGIQAFFAKRMMKKAGAAVPSANRISLLRDADNDGIAELKTPYLENLYSPFGMALVKDKLYIANADGIVAFDHVSGSTKNESKGESFFALPAKPYNHHWTKNLIVSLDQKHLYAAVGSNSNIGEHGMQAEKGRASIWKIELESKQGAEYATGLRNPVGMDFDQSTNTLFTVVNERDELGNNLVPDYLTSVTENSFYGWPYSYFGQIVDERVEQNPEAVAKAIKPDYALGSHTASLGLDIVNGVGDGMASAFGAGAFIGQHGSWNRKPRSGYKVIFIPFKEGKPVGEPITVVDDFLSGDIAYGRPVGVLVDQRGGLLVADDVGNKVWRVTIK